MAARIPEPEAPELVARNLAVGARLAAGATTFAFLGPVFAYLYLRSLNTADLWHPAGVDPPLLLGTAIVLLTAASAVVLLLASRRAAASRNRLLFLASLSFLLGIAAVALQVVEYFVLGFGPTDGGYASVFVAWSGLTAVFALGTMLWLETLIAFMLRGGERDPSQAIGPRFAALAFYWAYLAGLGIVMWVCLYVTA